MKRGKVTIIQGGQYGSEGKGQVASEIVKREGHKAAIRTGSINAGHTTHFMGMPYAMQIIPTAWVVPDVKLILGAGVYIHPEVLIRELQWLKRCGVDVANRLLIDERAAFMGDRETGISKAANRHHKIGATGKGCSEAMVSKMRQRGTENRLFFESDIWKNSAWEDLGISWRNFVDTTKIIDQILEEGGDVLLEGTQGSLLDFNLGNWPYVTSRMCNAAAWLAEAGISPAEEIDVVLVCRTFPIRVAGNSGRLPKEMTWPQLARQINDRLKTRGLKLLVNEDSLHVFETFLRNMIKIHWPEVFDAMGENCINWGEYSETERERYQEMLSEANAKTVAALEEADTEVPAFFEKTTVTKKLRRIAALDTGDLRDAIRWNKPSRLVITFLNYAFPEHWGKESIGWKDEASAMTYVSNFREQFGVPVDYVTTGPLPEHMIHVDQKLLTQFVEEPVHEQG